MNNEIESRGAYLAGAWKITPRLTLRADYEDVRRHAIDPTTIRLNAPATNATYGSRANQPLRLLIAQGRAGDLFNGGLNYANADAFGTDVFGEVRTSQIFTAQVEAEVTKWLSILVQAGTVIDDRIRYNSATTPSLSPPGLNGNPTGDWAVQLSPLLDPIRNREKAYRAIANVTLPTFRFVKSELSFGGESRRSTSRQTQSERWYEIDANGEFIRNAALINNGNSGRTVMGNLWWAPGTQGFDGPAVFRSPAPDIIVLDGKRYRRDFQRNQFAELVTPDNPRGFAQGSTGINWTARTNDAAFAALSSSWFDDRIDTLAGYRFDWLTNRLEARPQDDRTFNVGSFMLGLNYHVTRWLTPYYAHSTSFQPSGGLTIFNQNTPEGRGVGDEVGLKFDVLENKITGSISAYSSAATNNNANLPQDILLIVNPVSNVNGRRNGGGVYVFDRKTKGYEINLTAAPTRGWRVQASFSHIAAKEGSDVILPILYNDQFNTNAAGQVTFSDGRPLLVPVNPATTGFNAASPTPGVATQPLTVGILRNGDASGNYKATLNPNSGQITNAPALYLNTPGVGTGTTGLPITQHQLGFISPTGATFLARQGGDRTTGFASNSISVTTNYRFSHGWMKGIGIGGNIRQQLDQAAYYYVDRRTNPAGERKLYFTPNQTIANLFASYEFKFKRGYVWRTQINIANLFNTVNAIIYPDLADGTPDNVRLTNPPRVWTWTNSIRF